MIRLVLAAVLALAGIVALTRGTTRTAGGKPVNLRLIGASGITVGAILLASASTYRLDSGEAAVFKKFGVRNQTITLAGNSNAEGEDGAQVQTVTSDNATVTYDTTIRYSLNPGML